MSEFISLPNALVSPAQSASLNADEEEQFLRFSLEPDVTALLPLQHLSEVLYIPGKEIVPIFFMPPWVTGVYNLRGEILWIVDLGHLLELTPYHQPISTSSSLTIIVLNLPFGEAATQITGAKTRNLTLGCIISSLEAIEQCDTEQIQPPQLTGAMHGVIPFLQGYWLKSDTEMLAVLNTEAIVAALPKLEI